MWKERTHLARMSSLSSDMDGMPLKGVVGGQRLQEAGEGVRGEARVLQGLLEL